MSRKEILLSALLGPAFLYPAFYAATLLADTLLGEEQVLHHVLAQSKRFVWDAFWADWLAALPFSYLLLVPAIAAIAWIAGRFAVGIAMAFLLGFVGLALLVAITMLQGQFLFVTLLTAICLWVPLAISLRVLKS